MHQHDLISVIIPIYKVELYLRQCIDSVLSQTYANLQIILVDDGSPDECPKICDEYAAKDNRVQVIHQENGGLGSARNAGIDIAEGKYIGFVDSDDYILPGMYERLLSVMNEYDADLVECSIINGATLKKKNMIICSREEALLHFSAVEVFSGAVYSKLFKTDIINGEGLRFDPDSIIEDVPFAVSYMRKASQLIYIPDFLYVYRQRHDSLSKTHNLNQSQIVLKKTIKTMELCEESAPGSSKVFLRRPMAMLGLIGLHYQNGSKRTKEVRQLVSATRKLAIALFFQRKVNIKWRLKILIKALIPALIIGIKNYKMWRLIRKQNAQCV